MTGNVLKEIEENIKDYEEQGIEQIPLSLVEYWISVLGKENEQLKKRLDEVLKELYCKDRRLEELGEDIECCDKQ